MVISNLKIGTSYFFTPLEEFAKENIRYHTPSPMSSPRLVVIEVEPRRGPYATIVDKRDLRAFPALRASISPKGTIATKQQSCKWLEA